MPVAEHADPVLEKARDAKQLVMAIAWIRRHLHDHVRRDVRAVGLTRRERGNAGVVVVGRSEVHAGAIAADGISRLRTLQRRGQPIFPVSEILGDAELRLPGPGEAGHVLLVDGERQVFLARRHADFEHGGQTPGLTGEHMHAKGVVVIRTVGLAKTRIVAVALVAVGGAGRTLQIQLRITSDVLVRVDVAVHQDGETALPGALAELALMIERRVRQRDPGVEVGGNVVDFVAGAVDAGALDEAAELDGQAANVELALMAGRAGLLVGGAHRAGVERRPVCLRRRILRMGGVDAHGGPGRSGDRLEAIRDGQIGNIGLGLLRRGTGAGSIGLGGAGGGLLGPLPSHGAPWPIARSGCGSAPGWH